MLRLLRVVTKIISSIPAATASSTIYCKVGLSTNGSISFGITLLAGSTRVPIPATGNTALRICIKPPHKLIRITIFLLVTLPYQYITDDVCLTYLSYVITIRKYFSLYTEIAELSEMLHLLVMGAGTWRKSQMPLSRPFSS